MVNRNPLGPDGTWKTGQRVYVGGRYVDQFGTPFYLDLGATFPPTQVGKKSICGFYREAMTFSRSDAVS